MLDTPSTLVKYSTATLRRVCRLIAEKINKNERKNMADITNIICGLEPDAFWEKLGSRPVDGKIKVCFYKCNCLPRSAEYITDYTSGNIMCFHALIW